MRFVRAAAAACLLGSAAVIALTAPITPAYAAKPSGPTVSSAVGKALQPAVDLMNKGDYPGALAQIKTAQAMPDQTPFDTYKINEFLGNVYIKMNDHVNADIAFEAMAESDAMPAEDKPTNLRIAALLATEQKHYDKGLKYGQAFMALGGAPDPTVIASMSEAYYYSNDFANAEAFARKSIAATPAGQAPNRGSLEILFGSQLKAKNQAGAIETLEQIVTYYDDPDDWGQVIDVSLGTKGMKDVDMLHIFRVRMATKATGKSDDYVTAANLALSLAYPVEADAVLQAGLAAGKVDRGNKLIADARSRAAKDRQTIAGFDTVARKGGGELELKLAETYYGYGRYADAADAARRALQKGGAKDDPNEANMVLGEALLMQGKTADAIAAFNSLKNPSPGMARAQHIWLLYANRKYATASAAPAH
jgi:tetratricopeptide (TPR) repeat protein